MKFFYVLIFLCSSFISRSVYGQTVSGPAFPEFDPKTMPVALDMDSSIQLIISDYILIKSLKTQMPGLGKVEDVTVARKLDKVYLAYTVRFRERPAHTFYFSILLYKGLQDAWYASNQSVTCSTDCPDCKAGCSCSNGGNCPPISPLHRISDFPLSKVAMFIEK